MNNSTSGISSSQQKIPISSARHDWIDLLRFVSVFGIIMIHVSAICWYDYPKTSLTWKWLNFYNGLNRFCLPCLVMISGALLLSPKKKFDASELWRKRILRILIAWVIWSFVYASLDLAKFLLTSDRSHLNDFIRAMLRGHFHLWYLAMLIGLYVSLPILRPIAADRKLLRYFLLLSFIVSSVIPSAGAFFSHLPFEEWSGRFQLFLPFGYAFYFMLGYYLYSAEISRSQLSILLISAVLSLAAIITGTYYGNLKTPGIGEMLYQNLHVFGALSAAGVFAFSRCVIGTHRFPPFILRFLSHASRYSFGIYLVHEFVSILLPHIGITVPAGPVVLTVPAITVLVYLISSLFTSLLHRIPVVNRYMV